MHPVPEMMPLFKSSEASRRSVFAPGHRIRMNVIPMFLNVFVPWGVFVFCCGICSFWVMYAHPTLAWSLITAVFLLWLACVFTALWARRFDPDPTWFSYAALMVGIMALAGTIAGLQNYHRFSKPYFEIHDLQVIKGVDASFVPGKNVMDAGIVHFASGNHLDHGKSWHFMFHNTYCVAPIVTNGTAPATQSYDFWAVGKDCCSLGASDFRCGSWGDVSSSGGIRLTESVSKGALKYYKLAVQQASSLYDIRAPNPIFLTWSSHPTAEVSSWNQQVFKNFMVMAAFALICNIFCMTMASCMYAFLGRARSVYAMDILEQSNWQQGVLGKGVDHHHHPVRGYNT